MSDDDSSMVADRVVQIEPGKSQWTCGTCGEQGVAFDNGAAFTMLDVHIADAHIAPPRHWSGPCPQCGETIEADGAVNALVAVQAHVALHEDGSRDPKTCPHDGAHVEATLATDEQRGLPWQVLAPEQRDLDGMVAQTTLGVCGQCGSRVVSVRSWEDGTDGPAWTSAWTRLILDGEQFQ